MKKFSKLLCFMVAFITAMVAFCTVSFAEDAKYSENLVPTMTSNTAPSGEVSASSYHLLNATHLPYLAFNHTLTDTFDSWVTADGFSTGWLCYKFSTKQKIEKYSLLSEIAYATRAPKSWTFEGSNDGSTWTVLDSETAISGWSDNVRKTFSFNNSNYYLYYRINISANNGASLLSIGEFEMMGK